jgi:hypothetical protein
MVPPEAREYAAKSMTAVFCQSPCMGAVERGRGRGLGRARPGCWAHTANRTLRWRRCRLCAGHRLDLLPRDRALHAS